MYCSSCKPIVEKQLEDEKAVKKIEIDYMTDNMVVDFDPSLITKEQIKNRLGKSGYKFVSFTTPNCPIFYILYFFMLFVVLLARKLNILYQQVCIVI